MLSLEDAGVSIGLGDFAELEKLSGGRLPQSFKRFYLKNNGGYIENKRLYAEDFVYSIHGFDSIKVGEPPIEVSYMDYVENDESFSGLIPFAFDEGGNNYMLSVRATDYGVVYLWLQDEEELRRVFSSFDDFEKGLDINV